MTHEYKFQTYFFQTSSLLDNAEKWGVKIVCLPAALKWIEKEMKKLPKLPTNKKVGKKWIIFNTGKLCMRTNRFQ